MPNYIQMYLFIILFNISCCSCKLEFVQIIMRHGERSPERLPYPNDEYTEKAWGIEWGEMTNRGIAQMHELGRFFRRRFPIEFISADYKKKEIYVRSTDVDRTLNSAQAFLFGFYPARTAQQQWMKNEEWRPVPVHASEPGKPDILGRPFSYKCPILLEMQAEEDRRNGEFFMKKYSDLIEILQNQTGYGVNMTFQNIQSIYDIQLELWNNMTNQPDWAIQSWPQYADKFTTDILLEMRNAYMYSRYNNKLKWKVHGGYLLNDWIQNAIATSTGNPPYKMSILSSHDTGVLAILSVLGVLNETDFQISPYGSAVFMQISSENGKYAAEFFYRNSTDHRPIVLTLPGCQTKCPVDELLSLYNHLLVSSEDQIASLCGVKNEEELTPTDPSLQGAIAPTSTSSQYFLYQFILFSMLSLFQMISSIN